MGAYSGGILGTLESDLSGAVSSISNNLTGQANYAIDQSTGYSGGGLFGSGGSSNLLLIGIAAVAIYFLVLK